MTLRIRGSAFCFGNPVDSPRASFRKFVAWVKSIGPGAVWPFIVSPNSNAGGVGRNLYCGSDATHFYGIFLSGRNTDFQHFVKQEGNKVIVEARSTNGNPPVEMNFFCMRLDSQKGLFSHYPGSYRFSTFQRDLWTTYVRFVNAARDAHLASLTKDELEKTGEAVRKSYSFEKRGRVSPLFTPAEFETLLDRLKNVDEVHATSYSVDSPNDQPVSARVKSVHTVHRFVEETPPSVLKAWLRKHRQRSAHLLADGRTVHSGSVIGQTDSGSDVTIDFENTMEDYLKYDYDALGTFEVDRIHEHTLVQTMLQQTKDKILFQPTEG